MKMLVGLNAEVSKFSCIDEIDETTGKHRWTKAAAEQFNKLD